MTPISFIRGRPAVAEADGSSRFVLVCVVLATLILLLCLTIFLTVRGGGPGRPGPGAARARVEAEPFAPSPAPAAAPTATATASATATATATASAPAPAPARPLAPGQASPAAERRARMLTVLRSAKGAITLQVQDDPAAEASARRLMELFQAAGWTVKWDSVFGAGPPLRGLSAALGDSAQDAAVRQAFAEAGIGLGPPPASGIVQTPEIFVGVITSPAQRREGDRAP